MDQERESQLERPQRKVQRHSPDRLLRQKVVLPGDITVSAEKHNGRLVIRVESPDNGKYTVGSPTIMALHPQRPRSC